MRKRDKRKYFLKTMTCALSLTLLSSCETTSLDGRHDLARNIAQSGSLQERLINTSPFQLTVFERISKRGEPINIYIEGDGLAWLSKSQPSLDPTPKNPLALKLASKDNNANVIYLARPCQYSGTDNGAPCSMQYWMGSRYAPDVISAYNNALDQIKAQTGASEFHLIGFSGGASVAAILAGQRSDIASLRSVAGNLDHRAHSKFHGVSMLDASLNPPQYAAQLAKIPQLHFIGGKDAIVPQEIYRSYSAALPAQNCTAFRVIDGADHTDGWAEQWPALLAQPVACR